MWEAIYEVWENVLALLEIGTSHEQEIEALRSNLDALIRQNHAMALRLLRAEARIRRLERQRGD